MVRIGKLTKSIYDYMSIYLFLSSCTGLEYSKNKTSLAPFDYKFQWDLLWAYSAIKNLCLYKTYTEWLFCVATYLPCYCQKKK